MNSSLFIPILLGSAREGRYSQKVARFVREQAQLYGKFETELGDVADFVGIGKTQAMEEKNAKNGAR